MSVHNSAHDLEATLASVLSQSDSDLELIAVDDGSSDGSGEILDDVAASDSRLRVVHQENRGLTLSLICACELARGVFIARQDAGGDLSLPRRFEHLIRLCRDDPETTLASSGVRYIGPEGEALFDEVPNSRDQTEKLLALDVHSLRGPAHHGAALFPSEAYRDVGGYRPQFAVAQDLDLWVRLAETGRHLAEPEILYRATVTVDSISSLYRPLQRRMTRLIVDCARRRRAGLGEERLLQRAQALRPLPRKGMSRRLGRSRALYFIGSCLRRSSPDTARKYFHRALKEFPLHAKSWWRLIAGLS